MNTTELQPTPLDPAAASAPHSTVTLSHVTGTIVALVVIGLVAGFIPRWRQRTALRAETLELSIPTVDIVSPTPGQAWNDPISGT